MPPTAAQVTAVERLVHESVHAVDALAPAALNALIPSLRAARDELQRDLQRWLELHPDGAEAFTAYQKKQALLALEASFERIAELHPAMAGALGVGRRATGGIAVSNLGQEVQRLSTIFDGGMITIPQLDTAAIIAQGNKLLWRRHERSAHRYAGGIGQDITARLSVSLAKGDTFEQMVQRLRGSSAFREAVRISDPTAASHGVADAMFHRWRHWADRLVRTENMHAYNVQHDVAIRHLNDQRHEDDEEYLRRWDATADKVTCPLCRELDRTVTTIEGEFKGGIKNPPRHPYCRCVVLAWLARWGHIKGEVPSKDAEGKDIAPAPDTPRKRKPEPQPAPLPSDALDTPLEQLPALRPTNQAIETRIEKPLFKLGGMALEGDENAGRLRDKLRAIMRDGERTLPDGTVQRLKAEDIARLADHSLSEARKAARRAAKPPPPKQAKQPKPSAAPVPAPSLPPASKPAVAAPAAVDRSIPAGAKLAQLRRSFMVERDGSGGWRLNDRGVQHFAAKAAKAAKGAKAKEQTGTCQICARTLAVVKGKISIHGYTRPGVGFISGECKGSRQPPFEISRDALRDWVRALEELYKREVASLERIDAREQFLITETKLRGNRFVPVPRLIGADDSRWAAAKERTRVDLQTQIASLRLEIEAQRRRLGEPGKPLPIPKAPPPPPPPPPEPAPQPEAAPAPAEVPQPKKNPKRIEAAKKAAAASAERRREIHSAVKSNLPPDLQVAWDAEGNKFMREEARRIRGTKDRINAASKLSEAFAEKYGSGDQTAFGNEGDRFFKRAEIEAKHAEKWADEQERKYYEAMHAEALRNGEIDEHGRLTKRGKAQSARLDDWGDPIPDDDDPPF